MSGGSDWSTDRQVGGDGASGWLVSDGNKSTPLNGFNVGQQAPNKRSPCAVFVISSPAQPKMAANNCNIWTGGPD